MILGHYHFVCQKSVAWFNFFETKNNRVAEFKKKPARNVQHCICNSIV